MKRLIAVAVHGTLTFVACAGVAFAAVAVGQNAPPQQNTAPTTAGYTNESQWSGTKLSCAKCHEAIVNEFRPTGHGKAMEFGTGKKAMDCGSCHFGDLARHSRTSNIKYVSTPNKETPQKANSECMTCHQSEKPMMFWQGSQHEVGAVGCLNCHAVHKNSTTEYMLAKVTESETCFGCHTNVRKAMFQRSRHLFRDERATLRMECSSCHNPHGSQTEKLISANSINDKCYSCHQEKRGPFLWEHSPVRENCMNCHTPHGSNNERLLTLRRPQLCQSCHLQQRHQVVLGRPDAMWNINRSCSNCHAQIHGSNHPSGATLNN